MSGEVRGSDQTAIKLGEAYFDWWIRNEEGFFSFVLTGDNKLHIIAHHIYPAQVRAGMLAMEDWTREEQEYLRSEMQKRYNGSNAHRQMAIMRLFMMLIYTGESKQC